MVPKYERGRGKEHNKTSESRGIYNPGRLQDGEDGTNSDGGAAHICDYMMEQLQPWAGGAYGSSPFPTGPQTDGT